MLNIVGLGPGQPGLISTEAKRAIACTDVVFIQTEALPQADEIAGWNIECISMDDLYETARDYRELDEAIAERLLQNAEHKDVAYCVYGSGLEGQAAAALAMEHARQAGVQTRLIPGVSPAATAAVYAGQAGECRTYYELPDMLRLDTEVINIFCDMDRQLRAAELKLLLMELYPEDTSISLVRFGIENPLVTNLQLQQLDRQSEYLPYSYVVVPAVQLKQRQRYNIADLYEICRILRAPDGCPWDREQTHASLKSNMLEEAHEAIAAIDDGDMQHFYDELGDVLLQVALHGEIAREHAEFSHLDVTSVICAKLIRRHPHVFANVQVEGTKDVLRNWDAIKRNEGGQPQRFGENYSGLPGLMQAQKLQKAAAKFGFDWPGPEGARDKLLEEAGELMQALEDEGRARTEMEAGDVLFAAVNMARLAGVDAESAMLGCCRRFSNRINSMQEYSSAEGRELDDYDLDGLNALWDRAKSEE